MIDVETLAVPAFLVAFPSPGAPSGVELNAAARSDPALMHCLAVGLGLDELRLRGGGTPLEPALRSTALRREAGDIALTSPALDGAGGWRASLVPVTDRAGCVTGILGICRRMAGEDRGRARTGDRLSLALQAIHGAAWRYDAAQGLYRGSDEIATLLGEDAPRPVAWAEWLERVHPEDLGLFLAKPAPDGTVEFRFRASSGELRWARCSRVATANPAGEVEAVLGVMVDITPDRVRETAWAELATHDPLTGLLNRRGLRQELDRLQADLPPASSLALFAVDLDHFKTTNDRHGHAAGDAVLVEASRRLAAAAGGRICARLGGDEFAAVLPVSDEAEARRLRERLSQEFRRPLAFGGRWLPVSASVGVACVSGAVDVAHLMDRADADLYARKHGRACALAGAA